MTCSTCHATIRDGVAFCPHCGSEQDATVLRSEGSPPPPPPPPAVSASGHGPSVTGSLLSRAKHGDAAALETMFRQFIDVDERVLEVSYLGVMGFLFGKHSFGCVTDRRVAAIRAGSFGELIYQDGYIEEVNSTVVYQPAIWKLYLVFAVYVLWIPIPAAVSGFMVHPLLGLLALVVAALPALLIPRLYYRIVKSGLVTVIREGVSIYMFADRPRLARANGLLRTISATRERRVARAR